MTDIPHTVLVLGGTGRTGSLAAKSLAARGRGARTGARNGADVRFDWDEPTTYRGALDGVDRLYLVTPVMRVTYAGQVAAFLDLAEAAGIHHVTYLRARPSRTTTSIPRRGSAARSRPASFLPTTR